MKKRRRRKALIEEDTSVLPSDIVYNILSRLPVKSLMRFKCVCRPWRDTISDSKFVDDHGALGNPDMNDLSHSVVFKSRLNHSFSVVHYWNSESAVHEKVVLPWKKYTKTNILGTCNGLVLLHTASKSMLLLWNPSTNVYSCVYCPGSRSFDGYLSGLCYDSSTDDYKAVLGIRKGYPDSSKYNCAVFSFKNKSFSTDVGDFPYSFGWILEVNQFHEGLSDTIVRGNLHWALPKTSQMQSFGIVYFDLMEKKIKEMAVPSCLDSVYFGVLAMGGSLCLYYHNSSKLELWMMNEYGDEQSWSRQFVIPTSDALLNGGIYQFPRPLFITKRGEVILENHLCTLVAYDPKENKCKVSMMLPAYRTALDPMMVKFVGTLTTPPRFRNITRKKLCREKRHTIDAL